MTSHNTFLVYNLATSPLSDPPFIRPLILTPNLESQPRAMATPPPSTGYFFPGPSNLHADIYPSISTCSTPSLVQPGKTVLVTGASRGIGRAIALQYAHASVSCLILCARNGLQLTTLEAEIKKINASIRVLRFAIDVTQDEEVRQCAERVKSQSARLDILVNNAGITAPWVPLAETDPSSWWQTVEVNLKGPYLMLHAFLPLLVSTAKETAKTVDVVNICSIGAHTVFTGASAYQLSKLAVLRLTEFVDVEYAAQGVNAVAVHPGGVPTDMGLGIEQIRPCESLCAR